MAHSTQNSKSILARALAEENLKVIHNPSLETAMFDVVNRTLMLPVWENISSELYDLLVGHEVGHALYTPDIDAGKSNDCTDGPWTTIAQEIGGNVHAQYVQMLLNIVEDARIEQKIKEKYPGLRRDFTIGYREMLDKDFFSTKDADVSKMAFGDRVNLHFKVGNYLTIPFSADEQVIVDRIEKNKSFEGTCSISSDIFDFIGGKKQNIPKTQQPQNVNVISTPGQNGNDQSSGQGQSQSGNSAQGNGKMSTPSAGDQQTQNGTNPFDGNKTPQPNHNTNSGSPAMGAGTGQVLEQMTTQTALDKNQQMNVSKKISNSNYYSLPTPDTKNMIVPCNKVLNHLSEHFATFRSAGGSHATYMNRLDAKYTRLMETTRPLIGQLIQQFDMKKAADEQKRTTTARSGKLDCDRLCLHKITDDIFLNYINIADGKNHGMVMVIDWSSSMQLSTEDVLTQVVLLSLFCRRMSIPFDVYLFSSQTHAARYCGHNIDIKQQWITKGTIKSYSTHSKTYDNHDRYNNTGTTETEELVLIQVLSSDMKASDLTTALKNLFTLGQFVTNPRELRVDEKTGFDFQYAIHPPSGLSQGNTPLDSAIIAMMDIVSKFQQKHKVQIVNTIFLTDGETGFSPIRTSNHSNEIVHVYCPFNKKEYDVSKFTCSTDALLDMFGDATGSTTVGFFVVVNKKGCKYINGVDHKEDLAKMHSTGFYECPRIVKEIRYNYAIGKRELGNVDVMNHGYDRLFILPTQSMTEVTEVDDALSNIPQNATLTRIRNTFLKAVETRTASRGFINRFADVIAQPIKR